MTDRLARLRRRAARERSAREQAESIAESAIAQLLAANQALDRRVADRTADLETALARLGAADAVKSNFLRGVAHEMSTPLHAIQGHVELIEAQSADAGIRSSARMAGEAAIRLNSALRTLLEFAAISSGDVSSTAERIRIGTYVDGLVERWRIPAARAGLLLVVEARPDPNIIVDVDPARLDQVLDALIDNAVRFGERQVLVEIAVDMGAHHLRATVSDEGPGIPMALGQQVFESFVRGNDQSEGFGVGLTVARAVAHALGGTLEMADAPSGGARFVMEIPLDPPDTRRS